MTCHALACMGGRIDVNNEEALTQDHLPYIDKLNLGGSSCRLIIAYYMITSLPSWLTYGLSTA